MKPDWYPAWRDEAIKQLKVKNDRLEKDFNIGHWSRYDYDIETRRLLFSKAGEIKVTAGSRLPVPRALSHRVGSGLGQIQIGPTTS
ncbi:hypothetical protein [Mesorhizobium sp. dw_380]|uniref:hypothetical protein n=1 Tax=Mesorhizobium sp. dw_380 TaxID=2812001 RepID=UPI002032BBF8|nr:hypothetical protein [Mesorhizobium sp. dw_380]